MLLLDSYCVRPCIVLTLTEGMRRCPDHGHHHLVRRVPGAQGRSADRLRPVTRVLRSLHVYRDPTRGGLHYLCDLLIQVIQVISAEMSSLGAEDVREGGQGG